MWVRRRLPKPTPVFDTYWKFAAERQRIFRLRLRKAAGPHTADPILAAFKFTNAYRASDRTSQYLIRSVIYDRVRPWRDTFLRVILFKLFNRITTWELLADHFGDITEESFDVEGFGAVLGTAFERGERLYSAAYIMPPPSTFGSERKHENHLRLLQKMLADRLDDRIGEATSMEAAYHAVTEYPSIGSFLGYQLMTDLAYAPQLSFGEDEFVVPGPGAIDGLAKCFSDIGDLTPTEVIHWTMQSQSHQFEIRGIAFDDLWERPLQLVDCQNLYCEVDKYARVAYPLALGRSGRSRIKQRYHPRSGPLTAWYPPKWGLNDRVAGWLRGVTAK